MSQLSLIAKLYRNLSATSITLIQCQRISLVFSFVAVAALVACANNSPNFVLIMCDDLGFSDIGCYGSEIDTPNIDRLAREGMLFKQFYNNAKCTTTRASIITGLYPRNGGRGIELLDGRMVTIAEALRGAGYQTALSGKWHLGSRSPHRPIDRGFDEFYGLMDGACNYFDPAQPDPNFKGNRIRVFGHNDELIKSFPADFYFTDAITDHAVNTIKRFAQSDRPWFAHVTYTAPHYPLHAKPADIEKYRGKYREGWDALRTARYRRQLDLGLFDPNVTRLSPRNRETYDWSESDQAWEDLRMAVYAAMVDSMDQNIGRILGLLDELAVAEDTVVVFLSDNGGCAEEPGGRNSEHLPGPKEFYATVGPGWAWAQNTPFRRYKQWMHEGGIATPMVIRYPAMVKGGTSTDQVGHIIDFMPTFLDLASVAHPREREGGIVLPLEGMSLKPALTQNPSAREEPLFWCFNNSAAIRELDWKLVWDRDVKKWELYDLSQDRSETNDLATSHPHVVEQLSAKWLAWADETNARVTGLNRN